MIFIVWSQQRPGGRDDWFRAKSETLGEDMIVEVGRGKGEGGVVQIGRHVGKNARLGVCVILQILQMPLIMGAARGIICCSGIAAKILGVAVHWSISGISRV